MSIENDDLLNKLTLVTEMSDIIKQYLSSSAIDTPIRKDTKVKPKSYYIRKLNRIKAELDKIDKDK